MHRLFTLAAFLAATPLMGQWTVSAYTASAVDPNPVILSAAVPLALNPAGSVVIASAGDLIWRIRAGGVAERIAGTGVSGFSGDGGPATAAQLYGPQYAQADSAGNVYFLDTLNNRIRRIDTNGIITTVAGTGVPFALGMDREGPATLRSIGSLASVAAIPAIVSAPGQGVIGLPGPPVTTGPSVVRSSGDVYFADGINSQYQIRRLNASQQLEVVAGVLDGCPTCSDGDRVPALSAHLQQPRRMAFDGTGNLYIVEGSGPFTIRRLSPDGVITNFAGFGSTLEADGQPAISEYFGFLREMAADTSGNVYVNYFSGVPPLSSFLLRRIGLDGLIHTITQLPASLYTDPTGRVFYRIAGSIFDTQDDSLAASVPGVPLTPSSPTPNGTAAQDVRLQGFAVIAVSRTGELHYSEECQVRKFDQNAILRTLVSLPCGAGGIGNVGSMAFDLQNRLWIRAEGRTFIVSPDGQLIEQILPQGLGPESNIAIDAKGRIYGMGPSYLNRLETDGTVLKIVLPPPPDVLLPQAIGNDPQGNVYYATLGGVFRIEDDGSVTKIFGEFPNGMSTRLDVDAGGRVWRGLAFTSSAGTFYPGLRNGYAGDEGLVQSARFGLLPFSALAPDGSLYVFDNGRIRKLTPVGRAATPVILSGGIVHSASYTGGSIAPGELISIFGSQFGPAKGILVGDAVNNVLPPALGRTKVVFGGLEGKIAAVTPNQINVFVPYGVTIGSLVDVVVLVDDSPSPPMRVPVAAQAFGLFTLDSSGSGQGAILNQDGSVNGPAHPAFRGNIVSLFGTGEGLTFPALLDGALEISTPYSKTNVPVTVKVNGIESEVLYAGAAPTLPTGAFQINVRIPPSLPRPGLPPADPTVIVVTVGNSTTTRNVTVAVQ